MKTDSTVMLNRETFVTPSSTVMVVDTTRIFIMNWWRLKNKYASLGGWSHHILCLKGPVISRAVNIDLILSSHQLPKEESKYSSSVSWNPLFWSIMTLNTSKNISKACTKTSKYTDIPTSPSLNSGVTTKKWSSSTKK